MPIVPLDTVTGLNSNYFIATIFLFVRRHTGKIIKGKRTDAACTKRECVLTMELLTLKTQNIPRKVHRQGLA